jgi:hypothetical protein
MGNTVMERVLRTAWVSEMNEDNQEVDATLPHGEEKSIDSEASSVTTA